MPLPSNLRALALTGAALACLTACKVVGPDFASPAVSPAAGYRMAGDRTGPRIVDAAPQAGVWWSALGSPDLDRTIRLALADSPTVAEAEATLTQAREAAAAVRGSLGPQAQGTAGVQRERINTQAFGFTGFPSPTISLFSLGASVSYDLDLFGGGKRSLESARARAEAQGRRADAAYLTLSGNVAAEAVEIASLRAQIAAVGTMIEDDRRLVELARTAAQLGGAAPSSGVGVEAQLASDQALLPPLERSLAQHRHALALLVGKSPAEFTAPDFDLDAFTLPSAIPVDLPSNLVRRRPDILAAEADLHAATADIGVATAKLYPDIRLTAALNQQAIKPEQIFGFSSTGYDFGAGLTAPLFNGGMLKANRRAAEAAARASLARYQRTVLTAFVQVSDTLQALADDETAISAQQRSLAVAEAALRDNRLAYEKGGGTLLPVLDAQRQVHAARRNLAAAKAQRLSDTVRLFIATGADWRTSN